MRVHLYTLDLLRIYLMATPHSHNLIHAAREQLKFSICYIIVSIKRISNSKSLTYLPLLFMKLQDSVLFYFKFSNAWTRWRQNARVACKLVRFVRVEGDT